MDGLASTAEAEGGVENMLLVALTSLYTDEREADVRLGVLRVAINVLQRHGAVSRFFCSFTTCRRPLRLVAFSCMHRCA